MHHKRLKVSEAEEMGGEMTYEGSENLGSFFIFRRTSS
jgi:hypothetical protein